MPRRKLSEDKGSEAVLVSEHWFKGKRKGIAVKEIPVEREEDEDIASMKKDIEMLKLKKDKIVLESEIRKMEEEGKIGVDEEEEEEIAKTFISSLLSDPAAQKRWFELTEDQRNMILTSLAMLKANPRDVTVPLLLGMMNRAQSPGITVKDLAEYTKSQIEMAKSLQPPQQPTVTVDVPKLIESIAKVVELKKPEAPSAYSPKEVMDLITDFLKTIAEKDRELIIEKFAKRVEDIERRQISPIEMLKQLKSDLEVLGIPFTPRPVETSADLQIKLKEMDMKMEQQKLEFEKWRTEREWEQRRWMTEQKLEQQKWNGIIKGIIGPTMERARPIIDAAIGEAERKIRSKGSQVAGQPLPAFICPKDKTAIPIEGAPEEITCPTCNTVYRKKVE